MSDSINAREGLLEFLGTVCRPGQSFADVADDVNLFDAGIMDSLAVIEIILFLEQRYGVTFAASGIDPRELATVAGILEVIEQAAG